MNWQLFIICLLVLSVSYYMYYITKDIEYIEMDVDIVKCSCKLENGKLKCTSLVRFIYNEKQYEIYMKETYCDTSNKKKIWINPENPTDYATSSYYKLIYPSIMGISGLGLISSIFI